METIVGAVLKQRRLVLVRALVKIVTKLVMNHSEIFLGNLNAHFDAKVLLGIYVPGAGVADDLAIAGFGE